MNAPAATASKQHICPDAAQLQAKQVWCLLIAAVVLPTAAFVLYLFPPEAGGFYPPCPAHALTGYYCAGCGATRAAHALLHGDFAQALAYNALFVLTLPIWIILAGRVAFATLRGNAPPLRQLSPWLVWVLIAVVLMYTLLRNLPYSPFALLAPHKLS